MKTTKTLYLGDNGRLTCADLHCAGMTAHFSGISEDLSGQPFAAIPPEQWDAPSLARERTLCGTA